MNARAAAEEHLRVIRSLMERATIYRAISAPTALVGGIAALLASGYLLWRANSGGLTTAAWSREFIVSWLAALAVTLAANTLFLWRGAAQGQRPFFSPGLRLAVRAIAPSILVAAVVSSWVCLQSNFAAPVLLATVWMCLYGLALLATASFAPRSLLILGWCFVVSALSWLFATQLLVGAPSWDVHRHTTVAMALTFGVYHLVYAACTWARGRDPQPTQLASE